MSRSRAVQLISLVLAFFLLLGASFLSAGIDRMRVDMDLVGDVGGADDLPITYRMLNVMGGPLQAFIVSSLSANAEKSKEEGQFFLANQQYLWITALQPRFARVWTNLSWNMAYNISVATHSASERWEWVNKGLALLRDKGLVYNPHSVELYRELVRIYNHKIGGISDDAHHYYKARVALEWQGLMGIVRPGSDYDAAIDWMKHFKDMHEAYGADTEKLVGSDEVVKGLHDRLVEAGYGFRRIEDIERLVTEYGNLCMVNGIYDHQFWFSRGDDKLMAFPIIKLKAGGDRLRYYPGILGEIVGDFAYREGALDKLFTHLRCRVLVEVKHMDIAYMWCLMARIKDGGLEYGPLDWRSSATHGFYWASKGVDAGLALGHQGVYDLQNVYRDKIHAMQSVRNQGRLFFDPARLDSMITLPMIEAIAGYDRIFERGRKLIARGIIKSSSDKTYMEGHENYLARSSVILYMWGEKEESEKYFLRAKAKYGAKEDVAGFTGYKRYNVSHVEFVKRERLETWESLDNTIGDIAGLLFMGNVRLMHDLNQEAYLAKRKSALFLYKIYMSRQGGVVEMGTRRRMGLPPFHILEANAFIRYFTQNQSNHIGRYNAWRLTSDGVRLNSFKVLQPMMRYTAMRLNAKVEVLFPKPRGYDAYAKALEAKSKAILNRDKGIKRK